MREVPSPWQAAVLVCGKCSKRVGGGFGPDGRTGLAKALRKRLDLKKGRKAEAGVVEVKCLGLCPKRQVVVVSGAEPGRWKLVDPGTDLDEVARALDLPSHPT